MNRARTVPLFLAAVALAALAILVVAKGRPPDEGFAPAASGPATPSSAHADPWASNGEAHGPDAENPQAGGAAGERPPATDAHGQDGNGIETREPAPSAGRQDFVAAIRLLAPKVAEIQKRMKLGDPAWDDESRQLLLFELVAALGEEWKKLLLEGCSSSPGTPEADFVFYLFTVLKDSAAVPCALEGLDLSGLERIFAKFYLSRHPAPETAAAIRRLLSGPVGDFKGAQVEGRFHPLYLAMAEGDQAQASAYFCERARFAPSPEASKYYLDYLSLVACIAELDQVMAMLRSERDPGNRTALVKALARMKGEGDEEMKALVEWSYSESDPDVRAVMAGLLADKAPSSIVIGGDGSTSIRTNPHAHQYVPSQVVFRMTRDLHSSWFRFRIKAGYLSVMEHRPGWTVVVDALEDMLQDPSEKVRTAVLTALAGVALKTRTLESEEVVLERIRLILQAAASGDQEALVREHAAKQMERLDRK